MHIAEEIGIQGTQLSDLYYALLMKDAGCSSNASKMFQILGTDDIKGKHDVKTTDWTKIGWESLEYALSHVKTGAPFLERVRAIASMAMNQKQNAKDLVKVRCERGAAIARRIGLSEGTAEAIYSLDELWNGLGQPEGLRGKQIPLLSRIMNLAQVMDVFYVARGEKAAEEVALHRSGRWFDPSLVKAVMSVSSRGNFWSEVANADRTALELEPLEAVLPATDESLDRICLAFADVVDAKSPFTYRHSTGVAGAAVATGRTLGLPEPEITLLRRAALLHDIGKLSVSNAILDKPSALSNGEWLIVKEHPHYSLEILRRVPGFKTISELAGSHHEKLDGTGYFRNLTGREMPLHARILVVSDIFDALHAKRSYRDALPPETVFQIMGKDAPRALDANCFEALKLSYTAASEITAGLLNLSLNVQESKKQDFINQPSEVSSCSSPVPAA
jgi:putative nucleotidyltransferase with HDIG domain